MEASLEIFPSKVGRSVSDPVRLLYSGNIGAKQGLLEYCKILHASKEPFDFAINGVGSGADQIAEWAQEVGDTRFKVGPLLSEDGFAEMMYCTDYYVITEKPGLVASFFPSKSIPAMASGTPILAVSSPDSPLGIEMNTYEIGYWSAWDNITAMQHVLSRIPNEFTQWQTNALRRYTEHYARERCLDVFYTAVMSMVGPIGKTAPVLSRRRAPLEVGQSTPVG